MISAGISPLNSTSSYDNRPLSDVGGTAVTPELFEARPLVEASLRSMASC